MMNHLPEDVIIMIFDYLDNDSMFNTIKSSDLFLNIFCSSSKLLLKFNLFISPLNVVSTLQDHSIQNIPFKNVTLFNFSTSTTSHLQEFINNFKNSIEILKLQNITFDGSENLSFSSIISQLPMLKSLHLEKCYISGADLPTIPTLKSVTFDECRGNFFKFFTNQLSIEKIKVVRHQWTSRGFSSSDFNVMARNLPNFNHFILDGTGTSGFFDSGNFPFKIQKLEAYLLTFSWTHTVPRLEFFKSQQGHLKELTIHKLPYDFDGGQVLKFIIEKMRLNKFYFGGTPLILDGKKQEVKEFLAMEVNITAAFEMFRQFPSIQSFTLFLTQTGLIQSNIDEIINPSTEIFQNLKHLDILDHSGSFNHSVNFIGLYKNCRNITKLSLRTDNKKVGDIMSECLSYFTNLNEIYLTTKKVNLKSLKIIKNLVPNLKKLSVSKEAFKDAKKVFGNDVEVVEII